MPWTTNDLPDLSDHTLVVTGGNSGLGLHTSRHFARRGGRVVLACRDLSKAKTVVENIRSEHPDARVEALELDLANLASVRLFADRFASEYERLDVLCNNAGVMALPQRRTADGFEMQFGTNHLGHFALTGLLIERLLATPGARVVTVSSTAHKAGRIRLDDLQRERSYARWSAYAQSKLANLHFAFELNRRLEARGLDILSVACHPGYADTGLQFAGPRMQGSRFGERAFQIMNRLFSQSAEMGALPTLYAATAGPVRGGDYIGPDGFAENRGHPTRVRPSARARDTETAAQLWAISEELTGVRYEALAR